MVFHSPSSYCSTTAGTRPHFPAVYTSPPSTAIASAWFSCTHTHTKFRKTKQKCQMQRVECVPLITLVYFFTRIFLIQSCTVLPDSHSSLVLPSSSAMVKLHVSHLLAWALPTVHHLIFSDESLAVLSGEQNRFVGRKASCFLPNLSYKHWVNVKHLLLLVCLFFKLVTNQTETDWQIRKNNMEGQEQQQVWEQFSSRWYCTTIHFFCVFNKSSRLLLVSYFLDENSTHTRLDDWSGCQICLKWPPGPTVMMNSCNTSLNKVALF